MTAGKKIIVLGGVAGGASFVTRMRRLDETAQLILIEKGEFVSFANCGLPYHIGEVIVDRSKLLVQTADGLSKRFAMQVRPNSEVTRVDTAKKTVTIKTTNGEEYEESYDVLVLSPGANPIVPPRLFENSSEMESLMSSRVFTLRNIPDMDKIKAAVDSKQYRSCLVVGGGFIGVETAENLVERGVTVALVENNPHVLMPFDTEIAVYAHRELEKHGVRLILQDGVNAIKRNADGRISTTLNSGRVVESDLVILAIGVTPDTAFLKGTGVELGPKGHIITNERLQTNIPDVYAVGDAIEVKHYITGQKTAIPLAGPANKQGRIAADVIAGLDSKYEGTQGTAIIKVFDLTLACTGCSSSFLDTCGVASQYIHLHPNNAAGYYPGAKQMTIKLVFEPKTGKILGAQSVGTVGVDKRIDVIATTMRFGGTIDDLTELELAYAPPYSSAKDPVNFAGFIAENVLTGKVNVFHVDDVAKRDVANSVLVDVRSPAENKNGTIPGSINVPVDTLRQRLDELDKSKEILVFCQVGLRGYIASRILLQHGFTNVKNLSGGYLLWSAAQFTPAQFDSKL